MDEFMDKVYEKLKGAILKRREEIDAEIEKLILSYSEEGSGEINMDLQPYCSEDIERFVQKHQGLTYSGKILSWSKWFWDKFYAEEEKSNVEKS